ncbi:hypothetical protein GCK72_014883 [Caenorhabditis remanei]|uniref:Uncharacterized protein n=1 Tax=Caenorhabditis remanei TaxID=31234 RepID=A0A6A5GVA3_CAERE|nr:hypothetical protein GCK72_014883 [Caenorhabditis remanei]KAF1758425.1 hypothetical protein GCK72_014883 [Caenorhabditis remanei]
MERSKAHYDVEKLEATDDEGEEEESNETVDFRDEYHQMGIELKDHVVASSGDLLPVPSFHLASLFVVETTYSALIPRRQDSGIPFLEWLESPVPAESCWDFALRTMDFVTVSSLEEHFRALALD